MRFLNSRVLVNSLFRLLENEFEQELNTNGNCTNRFTTHAIYLLCTLSKFAVRWIAKEHLGHDINATTVLTGQQS